MRKPYNFESPEFIQDVANLQTVFRRRGEEEKVKELITYVIRRVRQVIEFTPHESSPIIYDFTHPRKNSRQEFDNNV